MIHPQTVVKRKPKPSLLQNPYVQKFMDDQDMYGSKVYNYNFEGRSNINSLMGFLISIIVYIFVIKIAIEQTVVMVEGQSPVVS
jgi:hypothetical protein